MTPTPKERSEMTPEELAEEKVYQEKLFEHLTSHLPDDPIPAKPLTLWGRLNQVVDWSVRGFIQWILVVVLLSVIVHLFIALLVGV